MKMSDLSSQKYNNIQMSNVNKYQSISSKDNGYKLDPVFSYISHAPKISFPRRIENRWLASKVLLIVTCKTSLK